MTFIDPKIRVARNNIHLRELEALISGLFDTEDLGGSGPYPTDILAYIACTLQLCLL